MGLLRGLLPASVLVWAGSAWSCTLATPHSALCPQEWLSRFGYLPPADPETGRLQTQEELSKAIATMQQFGGLEATGILGQFCARQEMLWSPLGWPHPSCRLRAMSQVPWAVPHSGPIPVASPGDRETGLC